MVRKLQTNREQGLPKELQGSVPRPIVLSASGIMAVAVAILLLAGALFGGIWLYARNARDADRVRLLSAKGITAEAQVTHIERKRGEHAQVIVSYRYAVDGREYDARTKLRKRDRNQFTVGSPVAVRYLPSRPDASWMPGYGPRTMPFWVVPTVPAALMLCVVPIVIALRRQTRLLAEGRPALAKVTKTSKVSHGEYNVWRVHYEWTLLNGATRTGRYDKLKNPPAPETLLPILYDRDNPRRHAPYPLSLVRAGNA